MDQPKVHIAGIGGEGWSWIAKVLIERGWDVQGCDAKINDRVKFLQSIGLKNFQEGNSFSHVHDGLDYFLYTSALTSTIEGRAELESAHDLGISSYDRNAFFLILLKDCDVIAIAGTHGKTTTTCLTAFLMDALGDNCGFGIGGTSINFNTNGRNGLSKNFVIEADEFGNAFHGLDPQISIITNMEMDHHDFFKTYDEYKKSFQVFIKRTKGALIVCGDSEDLLSLANESGKKVLSYGENSHNDLVLSNVKIAGLSTSWKIKFKNKEYDAKINFPGKQYALNASASVLACVMAGFDIQKAISHLQGFKGTERRFEIFQKNDITFVNDYGHHPTEIKVTLDAALAADKNVIVVYEPHQYKRCAELAPHFKGIFKGAQLLIQTEIYASREKGPYPIDSKKFFEICSAEVDDSIYIDKWSSAAAEILKHAKKGDLVLIFAVGHGGEIFERFKG